MVRKGQWQAWIWNEALSGERWTSLRRGTRDQVLVAAMVYTARHKSAGVFIAPYRIVPRHPSEVEDGHCPHS